MRFYLLYRNHGLYDPVLDDTELVYVPITQEEWQTSNFPEQTCNIGYNENQHFEQRNDTNNANTKFAKTQSKDIQDAAFQDQIRLNLEQVFPQINTEDIPPPARFKLPISDEYDPEGKKMSKLQGLYEKVLKIDLRKALEQMRHEEDKTFKEVPDIKQNIINKEIGTNIILKHNEMAKEEVMYTEKNNKELNTTKEMAAKIVENSINKALSVGSDVKPTPKMLLDKGILKAESKIRNESISKNVKSFKESRVEEIENKTNFTKDIRNQDKQNSIFFKEKQTKHVSFNDNEQKEEVSFSKEIEDIETLITETETKLTAEKRKLLTQRDIEEVIQPGTVRDRSEIFKKYNIVYDVVKKADHGDKKLDIKDGEHFFTKIKQSTKMAQQRAYKIGAQTILNIRRATYPSYSKVLLKTFFLHFTKVMLTFAKFITLKPHSYFSKHHEEKYYEKINEHRDYSKSIRDGDLIIKNKLSGAKIAQIEGMKPIELTDKMNIVILELQRKSGIEEEFYNKEDNKTEFDKSEFETKEFHERNTSRSKSKMDDEFEDASYEHDTNFNNKQNQFHTYETSKSQSMEIREMRSEKHYSEYKSTKKESSPCHEIQTLIRDADGNIIYIAIVESHVYTNKDAIFEEHLRRMSESKNIMEITESNEQSDILENTDKMDIYVAFDDTRQLSLASTAILPVAEYSTVSDIKERPVKHIRSATDMEYLSKKIAVQNIIQVIEPLLKMESNQIARSNHAHVEIEMPKSIAEKTDVATEEDQVYFQAQVYVTQKSYMSVKKPDKQVIEIKEITIDEDECGVLEESKIKEEQLQQPIIEIPVKSLAETSEVLTNEDQIIEIVVPEPKIIQSTPTIDVTAKSVAITSEVLVGEADLEILDVLQARTKTSKTLLEKTSMSVAETTTTSPECSNEILNVISETRKESATINVGENIATQVLEVSFKEPMNEEIKIIETKRRQSQPFVEESFLAIPETTTTFIEEPKDEEFVTQKPQLEQAKMDISTNIAAEVLETSFAETEQKSFDIPKVIHMKSETRFEKSSFAVAKKTQHFSIEPKDKPVEEDKSTNQKANLKIQEFNATEVSIVYPIEPEHKNLEIIDITEKQSLAQVVETNFTIAETLTILPEETSTEILEVTKAKCQQANIDIEELKAAEIITVSTQEFLNETLEIPKVVEKLPQTLLESCVLTVPKALAVLPEGPKDEYLEIPSFTTKQTKSLIETPLLNVAESLNTLTEGPKEGGFKETETPMKQPNIEIDIFKPLTTSIVFTEDQLEELQVPKIDDKVPQTSIESSVLTVAVSSAIVPEGPKEENLEINKISEEQIKVNFNEFHSVETTSISLGESIKNNLKLPKIIEKQPQVEIQEIKLNIAETLAIIPEEPKDQAFSVTEIKNQEARINIEDLKAAETQIITFEEIANEKLNLPNLVERQPKTTIVSSPLAVAETLTALPVETANEVTDTQILVENALKSLESNVNVTFQTLTPVAHTTIISIEETHDLSTKLKLSSQTARIGLVESTAAMVAETEAVTVAKEEKFKNLNNDTRVKITEIPVRVAKKVKLEDVDLNYTVELPKEHDDKVDEVFAEITLTKQKTPPVEVFAEFDFNEKKTEVNFDIFESIKLLKNQEYKQHCIDANYSYTALITDAEIDKKIEEELLQILESSKLEAEYVKSGDISYFTFPSPTLIPLLQDYMFRLKGPSLRKFKYMGDVFEDATLKLKSKLQTASIQNFDASLTLILQDIAISQLQSEVIDINLESTEYVSEKEVSSTQYFDSKKNSKSVEASVQSTEMQSLHTGIAAASAATKQTIETGIDVSVLAIDNAPIIEPSRKISVFQRKKKSKKSTAIEAESMQAESKSAMIQRLDASHSQAFEGETSIHAESLNANMESNMQQNLSSTEMSKIQESHVEMSTKIKNAKSKKASALSLEANNVDKEAIKSLESSISTSTNESDKKLLIKTHLTEAKSSEVVTNGMSISPPLSPPTPLTDEYMFTLEIPLPRITEYVPRDCSYSPEVIEDDIILKCGFIPHIITRIERIIYCPPLPTPPVSPERQIIPIYKKPVLKGGSNEHIIIGSSLFKFFC